MRKEEAFKAMESGAAISHITWRDRVFIRKVGDTIFDDENRETEDDFADPCYNTSWYIVGGNFSTLQSYQAEQLLKQIPLHLEDPNRVWCYSGHEAEPAIAKAIRALHDEVKRLEGELANRRTKSLLSDETLIRNLQFKIDYILSENERLKARIKFLSTPKGSAK